MKRLNGTRWKWWRVDAAGGAAWAAMTALVYLAGIGPLVGRHTDVAATEGRLEAQRRKASALAASLASLKRDLREVTEALEKTPLKLEKASRINQRLSRLADLAAAAALKVDGIEPGETTREPRYETVPILLSGSGTYRACAAFLHRLHEGFPDTGVSSFNVSGAPADPSLPAEFRFGLLWYAAPTLGGEEK